MCPAHLRLVASAEHEQPVETGDIGAEQLVDGLRAGREWAERELLERHGARVRTVLMRIMGSPAATEDMMQEVFARAFDRISAVHDPDGLGMWLTQFAINVAREEIKRRRRKRWLLFFAPETLPDGEPEACRVDDDIDAARAVEAIYEVLARMSPDLRIAFTLRNIEGMPLPSVAAACDVSLATIKRRLARAEEMFGARARNHPVLQGWVEEGDRWR